jgi:hypothetical protein
MNGPSETSTFPLAASAGETPSASSGARPLLEGELASLRAQRQGLFNQILGCDGAILVLQSMLMRLEPDEPATTAD